MGTNLHRLRNEKYMQEEHVLGYGYYHLFFFHENIHNDLHRC